MSPHEPRPSLMSREPLLVDEVDVDHGGIAVDVFRRDYLAAHRPLIVRGAVRHWNAMNWDNDYLRHVVGGHPTKVDVIPHDADGRLDLANTSQQTMRLSDLIDRLDAPDQHYYVLDQNLPPILNRDLGSHLLSSVFPVDRRRTFWWGRDGQTSLLHYDDNENFICQFDGEKQFLLFDVIELDRLYPQGQTEYTSASERASSTADQFPRFAKATPHVARIGPGDLLYVPCYWWHRVTSFGRNIAVSYIIDETMEQRVRVTGRLMEAGIIEVPAEDRDALMAIVTSDQKPSRRNTALRAYHRAYVKEHGQSYYPHHIFHRLIEESLADILRGHAAY